MGLAKYMEDNLERLYASLEDTRRQVSSIDENSSDKDWKLIKGRLEKELTLVSQQYDEVLKIVTNPQFDDFTEIYEENFALSEDIKAVYKKNDSLIKSLAHSNCTIHFMRKDMSDTQLTLRRAEKGITEAQKIIDKSEHIIEELKIEMAPIKNKLNNQGQRYSTLRVINSDLVSEVETQGEKIVTLELLLDCPDQSLEILNLKDDEIKQLRNELGNIDEWCKLLEGDLGIERDGYTTRSNKRHLNKNEKYKPKTLSSYLDLVHENDQLKSQVQFINQIVNDQKACISEKEICISKLKHDATDNVTKINDLEDANVLLRAKVESFQVSKPEEKKETIKIRDNNKIVTKKYEPPKKTIRPFNEKVTSVRSGRPSKQTTRGSVKIEDIAKQDSQQQFANYLNKYKKK